MKSLFVLLPVIFVPSVSAQATEWIEGWGAAPPGVYASGYTLVGDAGTWGVGRRASDGSGTISDPENTYVEVSPESRLILHASRAGGPDVGAIAEVQMDPGFVQPMSVGPDVDFLLNYESVYTDDDPYAAAEIFLYTDIGYASTQPLRYLFTHGASRSHGSFDIIIGSHSSETISFRRNIYRDMVALYPGYGAAYAAAGGDRVQRMWIRSTLGRPGSENPSTMVSIWDNLRIELASSCGNGIVDSNEECDDGNMEDGDRCSSECKYECAPLGQNTTEPETEIDFKVPRKPTDGQILKRVPAESGEELRVLWKGRAQDGHIEYHYIDPGGNVDRNIGSCLFVHGWNSLYYAGPTVGRGGNSSVRFFTRPRHVNIDGGYDDALNGGVGVPQMIDE